jgi:predicted TIM-barrel fold metal-dependent hydrolase
MAPILIALEEHSAAQVTFDAATAAGIPNQLFPKVVIGNLLDLGPRRLNSIDRGKMSIQVIPHLPTVETPEMCCAVNDQFFKAVGNSGGRFRGFSTLPMGNPEAVPAELERCVKQLGFVGALIPNHARGTYYDGKAHWPMFEKAQGLDVPIYIHPTPVNDLQQYAGNYDLVVQTLIAGPAICWHTEIAMHLLRLYASGVFDAYPRVKIILGHNGEVLPFMVDRVEKVFSHMWQGRQLDREWMTVWNENVRITTSGMFHLGPLLCCLKMCIPDKIMYSLDYPFEDPKEGAEFMEQLEKSGLVSPEQFEMICSGNAKKLLRL